MNILEEANNTAMTITTGAVDAFPWHQKEAYAGWLAQTYYYSCHTVSLLSLMVARTDIRKEPVLHFARVEHSNEEIGHDQWVRADLNALGYDLDDMDELPETRMLWEPQFYKCDRLGVESVYGYTIVLEQLSVMRGERLANCVTNLAEGIECDRFLRGHSSADVAHVEKDYERIRAFSADAQVRVAENMMQTAVAYSNMLEAVS